MEYLTADLIQDLAASAINGMNWALTAGKIFLAGLAGVALIAFFFTKVSN